MGSRAGALPGHEERELRGRAERQAAPHRAPPAQPQRALLQPQSLL